MKNFFRSFLSVLAVTMIASHLGYAGVPIIPQAPEMDPAMGAGALILLGGGIMIIRGRLKA